MSVVDDSLRRDCASMNRRRFLTTSAVFGSTVVGLGKAGAGRALGQPDNTDSSLEATDGKQQKQSRFSMHFAPHFGMFRESAGFDPKAQLQFAAAAGFTAWEYPGIASDSYEAQDAMVKTLEDLDMQMGLITASPSTIWGPHFVLGKQDSREKFLLDCEKAIETAKRVQTKWLLVVPGTRVPNLDMALQRINVVEQLKYGSELCAKHEMVMVLEHRNPWLDQPNMFLQSLPEAYAIAKLVDSPACKVLCHIYHQQVAAGNLIPNIDQAWDEICYVRIADTPGRYEPGTGEINYANVLTHLKNKGYAGIVGMDHGNSIAGKTGEQAVVEAYERLERVIGER